MSAQHTPKSPSSTGRFLFKEDSFGPRVCDLKTGRWMSTALVREMYETIPRSKRGAAAIEKAAGDDSLVAAALRRRAGLTISENGAVRSHFRKATGSAA